MSNITLVKIIKSLGLTEPFELCSGDTISITGPNGSGKSVLIEEIIGLREGYHISRKKNLVCGYVPQVPYEYHFSVEAFVDKIALMQKVSLSAKRNALKAMGVMELLKQQYNTTSSGEKKRILLACALMQKPEVLILDEFFQNIDIDLQKQFVKLFENLHAKNPRLAFVIISHHHEMPVSFFNKVLTLEKEN